MRVTESTIASNYLNNLNKTRERIVQLQTQLATGKRVNKSSDDPVAADTILRLKGVIDKNEQYSRNADDGLSLIEQTEFGLDQFGEGLMKVKEMLVRINSDIDQDGLNAFAEEMDHILSDMVDVANTKFNGKYIFGGTNTMTPPFALAPDRSAVTANPAGITGSIEYNVGEGVYQQVNIDGQEAFQGTTMFQQIIALRDGLRAGVLPTPAQSDSLNQALQYVTGVGAKSGALQTSMTAVGTRLDDQRIKMMELLSMQQDTDIAESTLQMKHEEIMLEAALNTGARIIPKSLLDYLQ